MKKIWVYAIEILITGAAFCLLLTSHWIAAFVTLLAPHYIECVRNW